MLSDADLRSLKYHEALVGKTVDWLVVLVPICLLVLANISLHLCSGFAFASGYNLGGLVAAWLAGVDVSAEYSGTFIMAMDLLKGAVVELAGAVILAIVAWSYHRTRLLNLRILAALRQAGKA